MLLEIIKCKIKYNQILLILIWTSCSLIIAFNLIASCSHSWLILINCSLSISILKNSSLHLSISLELSRRIYFKFLISSINLLTSSDLYRSRVLWIVFALWLEMANSFSYCSTILNKR